MKTSKHAASRIDEIISLLVAEALDLEKRAKEKKLSMDFVGALNNVSLSVSARVIKIMEATRAEERKTKEEKKDA